MFLKVLNGLSVNSLTNISIFVEMIIFYNNIFIKNLYKFDIKLDIYHFYIQLYLVHFFLFYHFSNGTPAP